MPSEPGLLQPTYRNRIAEGRCESGQGADLYYSEVLAGFYGFEYRHYPNPDSDSLRHGHSGKRFDPDAIGRARYKAACAAVSRAAMRLDKRGLARAMRGANSHWSGINLTPEGVAPEKKKEQEKRRPGSRLSPWS